MKKNLIIISFILMMVLITGCTTKPEKGTDTIDISSSSEPTDAVTNDTNTPEITPEITPKITPVVTETVNQETEESLTIADYYPFKENVQYIYEGEGNEYASYNVFTDYITENRVQLRINNGGSETVKVLENKNGQLTMRLSRGEIYYRENLTDSSDENVEILLMEPLVKGTEWTLTDNKKRYISNVDVKIITPAGTYHTLEVTTDGKDDKIVDYYAPEIGLVKTIFTSNDMEVSSSLSKIEENVKFEQTIKFYYPNVEQDVIYCTEKQISFKTNDVTRTKLEEAIKDITKDKYDPVLSPNVKINSLYLNKDNIVYVDFTKELVSEMNAGSGYEASILQCITNTLGNYYGVNKVYITLDGKPYESGHVLMKKGQAFEVNMENVIK